MVNEELGAARVQLLGVLRAWISRRTRPIVGADVVGLLLAARGRCPRCGQREPHTCPNQDLEDET